MEEATGLVFQPVSADDVGARQVVLELPEGVDTSEGVIMQIDGDKIHIITQGSQLSGEALGLTVDSLIRSQEDGQLQIGTETGASQLQLEEAAAEDQLELEESDVEEAEAEAQDRLGSRIHCFICAEPCHQPARLLLTRAQASGASLAERLGGMLPLRLRVSGDDGCCQRCRELVDQADQLVTELKSIELQVRQLFRLEEKLELEEVQREREQRERAERERELTRRREQARAREEYLERERQREREWRAEAARRREEVLSRLPPGPDHGDATDDNGAGVYSSEPSSKFSGQNFAARASPSDETADVDISQQTLLVLDIEAGRIETREGEDVDIEAGRIEMREGGEQEGDETQQGDEAGTGAVGKRQFSKRKRQSRRPWSPSDSPRPKRASLALPTGSASAPLPGRRGSRADSVEEAQVHAAENDREAQVDAAENDRELDKENRSEERHAEEVADEMQEEPIQDYSKHTSDPLGLHQQQQDPDDPDYQEGVNTTNIEFLHLEPPEGGGGDGGGRNRMPMFNVVPARRRGERKTSAFACPRCNSQFCSGNELVTHLRSEHTQPWCRRCRREFPDRVSLLRHRRQCRVLSHCEQCGARVANLEAHRKEKHPRRMPRGMRKSCGGKEREMKEEVDSASEDHPKPPRVIEFRDVSMLKEQVKDVKTPRVNILKLRKFNASDLSKIEHLSITEKPQKRRTNSSYTCIRCGDSFVSLKDQIQHLHTVHRGKSWCRRCRTEFPDRPTLLEHRPHCTPPEDSGECTICGKHVRHLSLHRRRHENPGRKRQKVVGPDGKLVSASLAGGECTVCKKYISHRLKRHVASHVQHPCPICKKLFSREDVIAGHIKRVHMKERPYICNQCGRGFVSLYSKQRHEMIHTETYKYYCQECGDGFRQKQQLTAHMRHKHGVVEIEFEDVTETTLLGELSQHADFRFLCQECGSGFPNRRTLTAHMRQKHGVANVVFEDVHLHVADGMGHLQEVSVVQEIGEDVDPNTAEEATLVPQDTGAAEAQWWAAEEAPY